MSAQSRMIAVLPARIRRRWDAVALQQLAEVAVVLSEQNKELAQRAHCAEQCADMWQRTAEIESEHGTAGLTIDGRIVRLDQSIGATVDDDWEYRGSASGCSHEQKETSTGERSGNRIEAS